MTLDRPEVSEATLAWAGRVWDRLLARECRGVLMCSDGYRIDLAQSMSDLSWEGIGRALQLEIAANLVSLELAITKAHRS